MSYLYKITIHYLIKLRIKKYFNYLNIKILFITLIIEISIYFLILKQTIISKDWKESRNYYKKNCIYLKQKSTNYYKKD